MSNFHHIPVLLNEVINSLNIKPNGTYVDGTLGGAGHAKKIVSGLIDGEFIGIDQDADAIETARERLSNTDVNINIVQGNFKDIGKILDSLSVPTVDGVLLDLGVSSHQIDTANRGFSYINDGPLDMRMNREQNFSAADVVNSYSEEKLSKIFHDYGEERWGKRIAQFICNFRKTSPIKTTHDLVDIIDRAIPKEVRKNLEGHSAKRVFQAIRIEVNDELNILENALKTAASRLNIGGRLAVITFHSLEDRVVKNVFKELATDCICPKNIPVCVCGHKRSVKIIGKPIKASEDELKNNSRAKSATLRVMEKVVE